MRIVLVHPTVDLPPHRAPRGPFINIMPQGLMGLADRLDRAGHEVEILHTGLERRLDPGFELVAALLAVEPDLVGLSLHWHHQLGPVGTALEALAQRAPELPTVLGGMTASAFPVEILEAWPAARFILRGEADEPLLALAQGLESAPTGPDLSTVANLTWREGGHIRTNPISHVADRQALDNIRFCRRDLIRHGGDYNAQFAAGRAGWNHAPVFYLTVGRGCSVDCAFCAGGASGQRRLAGRTELVFRSPEAVLRDVQDALDQGHRTMCICFDPPPRAEPYFLDLFERLRSADLTCSMVFECYRPPSETFLDTFARTFDPAASRLSFSPTVGDEALRRRLLGSHYTNLDLEAALGLCAELDLDTTLYFATVPQESREQLDRSLMWQAKLVARFGCRLLHAPIEMEPGAPWGLDPDRFGLTGVRQGFAAYRQRHGDRQTLGVKPSREVGYRFADLDTRLVRIQSHGLPALATLGQALALCGGHGREDRFLAPAAGRESEALDAVSGGATGTWKVLLSDAGDWPDWPRLEQLAVALGPQTRAGRFDPARVEHRRWSGRNRPSPPPEGHLRVLHLADGEAAEALLDGAQDPATWPEGMVLAEQCRFRPHPCPARRAGLVAVGRDGGLRTCPSSPDLGPGPLSAIQERVERAVARVERDRGCATCEVRQTCSQCPFPGSIPAEDFCRIRRKLGAAGLGSSPWSKMGCGIPGQPAIGWDE